MKALLAVIAVAVLAFGLHALQLHETAKAQDAADGFDAIHTRAEAQNFAVERENTRMEREIEQSEWNSPRELREQRAQIATDLAQDLSQQRQDQAAHYEDAVLQNTILDNRTALARIDARLKQLGR